MESEIGPLRITDAIGHDGQLYYAIARDPLGHGNVPNAIDDFDNNGARYRYRRILFPALAGAFGTLDGRRTLWGMTFLVIAAFGLASVALADLAFQHKLRGGPVMVALLNPGALVSALLLTADVLAIALALGGLALLRRSKIAMAATAFALAALTKEVYILVPVAAGVWLWRRRQRSAAGWIAVGSLLPLALWEAWLRSTMAARPSDVENIASIPFAGIVRSLPVWMTEPNPIEIALLAAALGSVGFGAWMLARGRDELLRLATVPWVLLAIVCGYAVWSKPNNAARAFAFVWPLAILLAADVRAQGPGKQRGGKLSGGGSPTLTGSISP